MKPLLAALLFLPFGLARAAVLPGFDAYTAWDQRLPGLLEFDSLIFPAAEGHFDTRWGLGTESPPAPPAPLVLLAADGGSTLRAMEQIRFDGRVSLIGDFTFEAPTIDLAALAWLNVEGNLHLNATNFGNAGNLTISGTLALMGGLMPTNGNQASVQEPPFTRSATLSVGGWGSEPLRTELLDLIALEIRVSSYPLLAGTPEPITGYVTLSEPIPRDVIMGMMLIESVDFAEVPLPAALPLFVAGLGVVAAAGRRGCRSTVSVPGS